MNKPKTFYGRVLQMAIIVALIILVTRFTQGFFCVVIELGGVWAALTNRRGLAMSCFMLLPFMLVLNPMVLPGSAAMVLSARIGAPIMTVAMMTAASRTVRGNIQRLPIWSVLAYMFVALGSSCLGYCPLVSYMKIVNFILFIAGIYYGTRNIHHRPEEILHIRVVLFVFTLILIAGSLFTLPFPSVAYYVSIKRVMFDQGVNAALSTLQARQMGGGVNLFCGIVNQSQCLAPMLACAVGWVMCDMIAVEKRLRWLHVSLLFITPYLLYLTRSRAGFLTYAVMLISVCCICLPRVNVSHYLKSKLIQAFLFGLFVLIVCACVVEARNHSISRWVRKTEDVSGDRRTIGEAFTASRMGKVAEGLYDFRKSPILGTGFQVARGFDKELKAGYINIFSAPIEKGFLPTMILGECGLVGMFAFLIFLGSFWYGCVARNYVVTRTLMVVYLATNFAEATFFSPGGMGGILWIITIVGGFVIDVVAKGTVSTKLILVNPVVRMERPK